MADPWHRNAIIYALEVQTFQDSDGDGRGDFRGLMSRLDYLQDLGVNCLWVLPFYPSPDRDNRYDVADYKAVSAELGTTADVRQFIDEAHRSNIRVIIDLIAHHTSDSHPWFQLGRADRSSPYWDYYVWSDDPPTENQPEPMFPGVDDSVWQYDSVAKSYFFHRFYNFQPDLNFVNPAVQGEMLEITRYWLAQGVDGFRIDAANHLFEEKGIPGTAVDDPCDFLTALHGLVQRYETDGLLLAEADVPSDEFARYTCDGNGVQLYLNFLIDSHLFLALARQSAKPVAQCLEEVPDISARWVNYLRNLDELDLERLTPDEQQLVYAAFAPDPNMRIYDRGIRRRLAPMLGGDTPRLRMALSVTFALPGVPLIVYGDEIGMGDDLSLPERVAVRTPMQWSDEPRAGFTTWSGKPVVPPVIDSGQFAYQKVNVAAERGDSGSLLNFVRGLIACRRDLPHFTDADGDLLRDVGDRVLAYRYQHKRGDLLTLHNFSDQHQLVRRDELHSAVHKTILSDSDTEVQEDGSICLGAYGFGWYEMEAS